MYTVYNCPWVSHWNMSMILQRKWTFHQELSYMRRYVCCMYACIKSCFNALIEDTLNYNIVMMYANNLVPYLYDYDGYYA